jgi:hypothetical protein
MKKELSPEGRLLALIKGPAKARDPEKPAQARAAKSVVEFLRSHKARINISHEMIPVLANRTLAILFIALSIYLVSDILFMEPRFDNIKPSYGGSSETAANIKVKQARDMRPDGRDYSAYQAQLSGRTLFGQASIAQDKAKDITTSASVTELFGLVGIIPGDNPKAIIEDKKAEKTYYLTKGESLNGFIVDNITQGSVELVYEGKRIELFL